MIPHTDSAPRGLLQAAADAPIHEILGGFVSVRLRGEDSQGQLAVVEQRVPPGYPGPPLHLHPDFDELFWVLDGELDVRIADRTQTIGAGGIAFVPRNTPHTFANNLERDAHALVTVTPAGHERFFEALVELVRESDGMPAPQRLIALNEAHGTEMVPPAESRTPVPNGRAR